MNLQKVHLPAQVIHVLGEHVDLFQMVLNALVNLDILDNYVINVIIFFVFLPNAKLRFFIEL